VGQPITAFDEAPTEPTEDDASRSVVGSQEARAMLRLLTASGVRTTMQERTFRCPRPWCHSVVPIDWERLIFRCPGCGIRGKGLKGLHAVRNLLNVPVGEWETKNPVYGELRHCPHRFRRVLGKDQQIRVDLLPCGAKACEHCGFLKVRTAIGHYGSKFLQCETAYMSLRVPGGRWEAMRRQASRKGIEYLRCAQPEGTLNIFHNKPLYRGDREVPRFKHFASNDAEQFWNLLVMSITMANQTSDKHLTASHNWQLAKGQRQAAIDWEATGFGVRQADDDGWEVLTHARSIEDLLHESVTNGLLPKDTLERPWGGRYLIDGSLDPAAFDRLNKDYKITTREALEADASAHHERHLWAPTKPSTPRRWTRSAIPHRTCQSEGEPR
jgi:hypothetical protein